MNNAQPKPETRLDDYISRFNQEYKRITGHEPDSDTWIHAHVFGTVMSEWSEGNLACQWCEVEIQLRVRRALKQVEELPPLVGHDAMNEYVFAMLYSRVGCMVTLDAVDPDRYMPVHWHDSIQQVHSINTP